MNKVETRECKKHGKTDFSFRSDNRWRCKKCNVVAVKKRRNSLKLKAIEYKGGGCERCGYNKCVGAIEFHHMNPETKSFGIGSSGYTRSWERIKKELDKCNILCANCHREEHSD